MIRPIFDVGVIGGGPAGSATALLLARAGVSVLLLEASDYSKFRIGETLPPLINGQLKQLGLMHPFSRQKYKSALGIMSVWGSAIPHINDFLFGIQGCGWHIDRAGFDKMLFRSAGRAGATVHSSSRIKSFPRRVGEAWALEFERKNQRVATRCKFLVNATGRSGPAWLPGASPRVVEDRLIGVAWSGRNSGEWPHTLVESVDDGWFYCASLPESRTIVVYMTDSDLYRQGHGKFPNLWQRQLSKTTHARRRLSNHADLSRLKLVSAATSVRRNPVGGDWCSVGDAAMSYDPLAGLGVHYALESAAQAAPAIRKHLDRKESLDCYSQWITSSIKNYRIALRHYYSAEQRWPNSIFWQRRRNIPCETLR